MKLEFLQQGDVLFFKEPNLPDGAQRLDHTVIAQGESTGHAHVAEAERATCYDFGGVMFVVVEDEADVTHQEHGTTTLQTGVWRVGRVQEFDPFAEVIRNVAD